MRKQSQQPSTAVALSDPFASDQYGPRGGRQAGRPEPAASLTEALHAGPDRPPAPVRRRGGAVTGRPADRGAVQGRREGGAGEHPDALPGGERPERQADPDAGPCPPAHPLTSDPLPSDPLASGLSFGPALPRFGPDVPAGLSLYKTGVHPDGSDALDFARELLSLGVLKESDWGGDLKESVEAGLSRWVNDDLGAKGLKVLTRLRFEYYSDARSYFTDADDRLWRHEMGALEHRPVGFLGFSWQSDGFRAVFVADKVMELEAAFPGLGYGLLDLLGYAFRWSCNGIGFDDGFECAEQSEEALRGRWMLDQLEHADPDDLDDDGNLASEEEQQMLDDHWHSALHDDEEETHLTTVRFHRLIPPETHETKLNGDLLPAACREIEGLEIDGFKDGRAVGARRVSNSKMTAARRAKRKYLGIVRDIMDLAALINHSSRTHVGADHTPLIIQGGRPLSRSRSVYLAWDPRDEMHRIADDLNNGQFYGGTPDLCWTHGFQLGHGGARSRAAGQWHGQIARDRPDLIDGFTFALDGSLAAAVESVRQCVRILLAVDAVLGWLHTPPEPPDHENEDDEDDDDLSGLRNDLSGLRIRAWVVNPQDAGGE